MFNLCPFWWFFVNWFFSKMKKWQFWGICNIWVLRKKSLKNNSWISMSHPNKQFKFKELKSNKFWDLKSPTFEKILRNFKTFSCMVQIGSQKYAMMFKFFYFYLFVAAKCGYIFLWIQVTFCYITKLIRKNCSKKRKKMKILMLIMINLWTWLQVLFFFSQEMLSHEFNLGAWLILEMYNKIYFSQWKEIECFQMLENEQRTKTWSVQKSVN